MDISHEKQMTSAMHHFVGHVTSICTTSILTNQGAEPKLPLSPSLTVLSRRATCGPVLGKAHVPILNSGHRARQIVGRRPDRMAAWPSLTDHRTSSGSGDVLSFDLKVGWLVQPQVRPCHSKPRGRPARVDHAVK